MTPRDFETPRWMIGTRRTLYVVAALLVTASSGIATYTGYLVLKLKLPSEKPKP